MPRLQAAPIVLFRPAAGPQIGGGHVMRDLSLATALAARGAPCVFAVEDFGARIVARFGSEPFPVLAPEQAGGVEAHIVVLDDFALTAEDHARLRGGARTLAVIDDLADRRLACDLLIDPSYARRAADYVGKLPGGATTLLGPEHALLRPAFAALRPAEPPLPRERVERVFISFGLSDVEGVTARAAAVARLAFPDAALDVALGPAAASLEPLRRMAASDPRLTVTVEATDVAERLVRADLAIGAGGSATWERACLGVPTVCVVVADNQRDLALALDAGGAQIACALARTTFDLDLAIRLGCLSEAPRRADLARAAWALTDGQGAERVAAAVLAAGLG